MHRSNAQGKTPLGRLVASRNKQCGTDLGDHRVLDPADSMRGNPFDLGIYCWCWWPVHAWRIKDESRQLKNFSADIYFPYWNTWCRVVEMKQAVSMPWVIRSSNIVSSYFWFVWTALGTPRGLVNNTVFVSVISLVWGCFHGNGEDTQNISCRSRCSQSWHPCVFNFIDGVRLSWNSSHRYRSMCFDVMQGSGAHPSGKPRRYKIRGLVCRHGY